MKKKKYYIIISIIILLIISIIFIKSYYQKIINKSRAQLDLYASVIKYNYKNKFPKKIDLILHDSFLDSWGNKIIYMSGKNGNGFYLKTLGKDNKEGGIMLNKDIILVYNMNIENSKGAYLYKFNK